MILLNINNNEALCTLDKMRLKNGVEKFKAFFRESGSKNKQKAINMINDKNLYFASLYLILPEIETLGLYEHLNSRNTSALKICVKILTDKNISPETEKINNNFNKTDYHVLKWIFVTGSINHLIKKQ